MVYRLGNDRFYQAMSIVGVSIALWINVCADDWTAERPIIASNVPHPLNMKLKVILHGVDWGHNCMHLQTLGICENKSRRLLPSATKLRRLCFYTCLSVHRGGVCLSACWDTTTNPPRSRHRPPPGACTPQQTATVADGTHPTGMHSSWSIFHWF